MSKIVLTLGAHSVPHPHWQRYVEPPEAAANLKDPVKIAEDIRKRTDKQLARVGQIPVTATLANVVLLNINSQIVFQYDSVPDAPLGECSRNLALFLRSVYPSGLSPAFGSEPDPKGFIAGFHARAYLRIMALEVMRLTPLTAGLSVPHHTLWHRSTDAFSPCVIDPYEELIRSEYASDISLEKLCDFFNFPTPYPPEIGQKTLAQAMLALRLLGLAGWL